MSAAGEGRLLIDVTRTVDSGLHTGIQRVVRGLVRGARQASVEAGVRVHPVRFDGDRWHDLRELPAHPLEARPAPVGPAPDPVPLAPRSGDLLLLADASWYLDPWPAVDALRAGGGRVAGFVHDLLPLHRPQWFPQHTGARFERHLAALVDRADHLLAATEHVAGQLRGLPGVREQRVRRLPLASSLGRGRPAPQAPRRNYFLAVATLEPRKQHGLLLDAFDALWADGGSAGLVLVGAPGWRHEALAERILHHPAHGRSLHWLRDVDDGRLRQLYRGARGLVYLSRDEGFGLPVLEAAALGCPVIASDIAPLREAGGGWPRYIPPGDLAALRRALACAAPPTGTPPDGGDWRHAGRALTALVRNGAPFVPGETGLTTTEGCR